MRISGVWTRLIESWPPAATISMRSMMTCLAAVAIAIRPDAHWRSMVWALTVTGQPARSATWRPMLPACVALGQHAAPDDVVDLAGLDPGALDRRGQRQGAERGAGVALNAPL